MSLRLPASLHRQLRDLAERVGTSINQLIVNATAEKVSALLTEEYLEARAGRGAGQRAAFDRILARVPGGAPVAGDEREPRSKQ